VIDMPVGRIVRGRDGRTLADVWDGSPHAHMGSTVPGFPNLFSLLGPNTARWSYMIESQIAYVIDALKAIGDAGVVVAGLDVALPAPHRALRPVRLPDRSMTVRLERLSEPVRGPGSTTCR
jgi:cation diffusion facilitator CzcD-associated flavoprotein CzcO